MISVVTQRGALVVGIVYGCPYYTGTAVFHLFFKVPQVKNRLFPTNPLPLCKPIRFVQSARSLVQGLSSSAKSLVQLGNTFTQSGCGCLKKCLQLSILLPLPSYKLRTIPKIHKKKKKAGEYLHSERL